MGFQNLERHQNDKERHARLNSLQGTVAREDGKKRHSREHEFQRCKAKPVAPWLHPKFHCECEQKKAWDPTRERAEHWRKREEQCCRQPKQWPPRNPPISFVFTRALTLAHVLLSLLPGTGLVRAGIGENATAQQLAE
jgi:hypothetical protein